MQDYYARYLPQMSLAVLIPALILLVIFPVNWVAGLILLATAPLIPLFMALVGMGPPMRTDVIFRRWRV